MYALQENLSADISQLFDEKQLRDALSDDALRLQALKDAVSNINEGLKAHYEAGAPAEQIVYGRSRLIDRLLVTLYDYQFADISQSLSLIAVGGYGRGELHPGSDIDLMILLKDSEDTQTRESIEQFLMLLWDSKLEIGHSVRTLDECVEESSKDITVATNIMEARLLAGDAAIFDEMKRLTGPDASWNSKDYFQAKLEEQLQRNGKYNDTSYNLEPNIKESRGGLRDIQMIGWVAKRHFGATTLRDLVEHNFLRQDELDTLLEGQLLLWRIRCSLHYLAGRREDRMLFDYQRTLASEFGYEDDPDNKVPNQAIETFMQAYFRTVMELERLNEMLLQLFREAILYPDEDVQVSIINDDFQIRQNYIEARSATTFKDNPCALLEIFVLIQETHEIQGVRAETIRLIREYKHLINDEFRQSETAKRLFMKLMSRGQGVTHELRRMNRYGILAAYIPAFESIVGRMQYDLFHAYTVDQHTLFVIRNVRRLAVPEFCHEYPLASGVFQHLAKPELLYLAALFHDIAKGRNGDHSTLGAVDALEFCLDHGLAQQDAELVSWLVNTHLLMSTTAQRKDISDPSVINEFASSMKTLERLDYLYLLTISDIRGTNPAQWNSWKDKLFIELYSKTAAVLNQGLHKQADEKETIQYNQTNALRKLNLAGMDANQVEEIWKNFSDNYFLRHTTDEVSWHTQLIHRHQFEKPLINVRIDESTNSLELFIHIINKENIFVSVSHVLSQMNLNIMNAHIMLCKNDYAIEIFKLMSDSTEPSELRLLAQEISYKLNALLSSDATLSDGNWMVTRAQKHFEVGTHVQFEDLPDSKLTRLRVETADRHGVLATIAKVFVDFNISIHDAFISTTGEKAIDTFDITDAETDQPLDADCRTRLHDALIEEI